MTLHAFKYTYVSVCVCSVSLHVYISTYMHVSLCMYVFVCNLYVSILSFMYAPLCTHVHMCTTKYTHVCICVWFCVSVYKYAIRLWCAGAWCLHLKQYQSMIPRMSLGLAQFSLADSPWPGRTETLSLRLPLMLRWALHLRHHRRADGIQPFVLPQRGRGVVTPQCSTAPWAGTLALFECLHRAYCGPWPPYAHPAVGIWLRLGCL